MKIRIKIKEVEFEIEDNDTSQAVRFYLDKVKELMNEVFDNYKKLEL